MPVASVPPPRDVVVQMRDGIKVLGTDGSLSGAATGIPGSPQHPDWSPGGDLVLESDFRTVWVVPADGGKPRAVYRCTAPCYAVQDASWSPDGRRIAFTTAETEDGSRTSVSSIFVIDAAGGVPKRIYRDLTRRVWLFHPRWSPDGAFLVFEEDTFATTSLSAVDVRSQRIGVVSVTGKRAQFLYGVEGTDPDWSPQGGLLVYASGGDLYLVRPDGRERRRLTAFDGRRHSAIQPTFAPDGRSVVFTYVTGIRGIDDEPHSAVIAVDGTGLATIAGLDGATHPRLRT